MVALFIARHSPDGSTEYISRTSGRKFLLAVDCGCFSVSSADAKLDIKTDERREAIRLIELADRSD